MTAVSFPSAQIHCWHQRIRTLDQFQTKQKSLLIRKANPVTESNVALNGSVYGSTSLFISSTCCEEGITKLTSGRDDLFDLDG